MVWITAGDPHARIFWILHLQVKQAMGDHPCLHWNLQANGTHPFLSVEWIPNKSVIQAIPDCLHPPKKNAGFLWNNFFGGTYIPPWQPCGLALKKSLEAPFHNTWWSPTILGFAWVSLRHLASLFDGLHVSHQQHLTPEGPCHQSHHLQDFWSKNAQARLLP